jgi:hypothetical protein
MLRHAHDNEAMLSATARLTPLACASVEVARENRFVWRGSIAELAASVLAMREDASHANCDCPAVAAKEQQSVA